MYAGPSRSLRHDQLASVDDRWAWMPKLDGVYCTITTDRRGCISNLLYRSGRLVSHTDADNLRGQYIGAPDAVLCGELEAQTEASVRARATRGYALLHLFDLARLDGRSLAGLPFADRYGLLHRWQAAVECYEPDVATAAPWWRDEGGRPHDVAGRFARATRGALARLPVVSLHRGQDAARSLWSSYVEREGGEGIVGVRLDAPLGKRGAKVKCKATDTISCTVVAVDARAALLSYRGHTFAASALCKAAAGIGPGSIVDVKHDGWYEGSVTPRFARIVRQRIDLAGSAV